MKEISVAVRIGGEAGQGLATIGQTLGLALTRCGYHLHVTQVYESRIRGGHNTFDLRAGAKPAHAPTESVDLLVALDSASFRHIPNLTGKALICSDEALAASLPALPPGVRHLAVPAAKLGGGKYLNTVLLGVAGALLGLDKEVVAACLDRFLGKRPPAVQAENRAVLDRACAWANEAGMDCARLPAPSLPADSAIMVNGNEAIALGAMAGGLKFCSFYPMSPATTVPLTVAAVARRMGIVVEQAEDEIAAVNMALGASYAGAPAMTATSGGGLALMSEGISLAGVAELPVVIVVAMRPGPATGLPTRTEQADLDLVLHAGHGEFPRAILAPGTLEQCFNLSRRAFVLAEAHQVPVFVLTDQYLADSFRETAPFALDGPSVSLPGPSDDTHYERYAITDSGISPRLLPGAGKALVIADCHEHTPDGHISENLALRPRMQKKRMDKLDGLIREGIPPDFQGPEAADILLVCWGSTVGAAEEAAELLRLQGKSASVCHFSQVWPLRPDDFLPRFRAAGRVIMVEGNYSGQMEKLIRLETGFSPRGHVRRYDGLPITAKYILDHLKEDRHA